MKRSLKTLKLFTCTLVCCAAVFIGSGLKAEASTYYPWECEHNIVTGYTIVGHYTDTHVICECCNKTCTMHHEVVKKTTYCTKCNRILEEKVEDVVKTHSSNVCKEILKLW